VNACPSFLNPFLSSLAPLLTLPSPKENALKRTMEEEKTAGKKVEKEN